MGRVVFISAGPGAADLITVRGAARLASADVVLFDALTDPALRDLAPQADWIDVGKRGFGAATAQARIDELLVSLARRYSMVARLKGGDASIFGRLEEELLALAAAGIPCEVVPGVTAALAAAADSQRPLTRRGLGRSLCFHTAITRAEPASADQASSWLLPATLEASSAAAPPARKHADTEAFYMAGRQLGQLGRRLRAAGWPDQTPTWVVSRAGWPDQIGSQHRLDELVAASVLHSGRPTVVTVGAGALPLGTGQAQRPAAGSLTAGDSKLQRAGRSPLTRLASQAK